MPSNEDKRPAEPPLTDELEEQLQKALGNACQAQSIRVIKQGQDAILTMPRESVLARIEAVAAATLPLSEEWEYRRLCELYRMLDHNLLRRLIAAGLESADPAIREAAEDFRALVGATPQPPT